jgi:ABC-2 type transport system permease protein
VWVELVRQAKRRRTLWAMLAVIVIPVIIVVALVVNGGPGGNDGNPELVDVASRSALNFAFFTLAATSQFLLVVVVALFAGDTIASEASWGSLRYLLTRPVPRAQLLRTKLAASLLYGMLAVLLVLATALVAGTLAFGWHPVQTPLGGGIATGPDVLRLLAATGYVAVQLVAVAALAFLFSTLTDAPLGAVGGAVVLMIVSEILDSVSALGSIRYGLPTHYWLSWFDLLTVPAQTAQVWRGLALAVPYIVVPIGLAFWWFRRKDILS